VIKKADEPGECQFCGMSAFDARQAEERLARLARVEILRAERCGHPVFYRSGSRGHDRELEHDELIA
jgi:hypothetical protein